MVERLSCAARMGGMDPLVAHVLFSLAVFIALHVAREALCPRPEEKTKFFETPTPQETTS